MSAIRVTCARTVGLARNVLSTAFAAAAFLTMTAVLFSFNLETAEGGRMALAAVWAVSVSPALPVLAAVLGMGVWSDERQSGRADVLLATAVRERDLVLGKFFGVLLEVLSLTGLSLVSTVALLWFLAPEALAGTRLLGFVPALAGVSVQGVLWCAVTVAASALCRHAATAAVLSVALTAGLPRGIWAGLKVWAQAGRTSFGEMPFDAFALDVATGVVPVGSLAAYLVLAIVMLFLASKFVAFLRLVGRGARGLRFSTAFVVALALVFAVQVVLLSGRIGMALDIPVSGPSAQLSPRTRGILAESGGNLTVTCFLPRKDARFRTVSRFLRLLKRESESVGGANVVLRYVDPRWDVGAAERLVRRGVAEESLVFERGRRMVAIPFREGYGERACASAIRRLVSVPGRCNVYWTFGHGECRFDEYGAFGMSDIARELARSGYQNRNIDLARSQQVPGDCALIVVAGAKDAFSRVEIERVNAYLREGGRLLVLLGSASGEGVKALLPVWGIRVADEPVSGGATLSGSDVIVSEFSDHAVTASLRGSRIVLERPVSFAPSAAAETGSGADRIGFRPLAQVGSSVCAAVVERGGVADGDLAIRPTRVVAIGDDGFVMNGQMTIRGNANRDFFLNCAAFLAGTDVVGALGREADLLVTGLDRRGRFRHALCSALAFPALVFLLLALETVRRRRRS